MGKTTDYSVQLHFDRERNVSKRERERNISQPAESNHPRLYISLETLTLLASIAAALTSPLPPTPTPWDRNNDATCRRRTNGTREEDEDEDDEDDEQEETPPRLAECWPPSRGCGGVILAEEDDDDEDADEAWLSRAGVPAGAPRPATPPFRSPAATFSLSPSSALVTIRRVPSGDGASSLRLLMSSPAGRRGARAHGESTGKERETHKM